MIYYAILSPGQHAAESYMMDRSKMTVNTYMIIYTTYNTVTYIEISSITTVDILYLNGFRLGQTWRDTLCNKLPIQNYIIIII